MSTIAAAKAYAKFQRATPICGNCQYEKRERNEQKNRTDRTCMKHGIFVLISSTCENHQYREKGGANVTAAR